MEELSVLFKTLDLEQLIDEPIKYNYINVFKNPNKLPINQVHLEKVDLELRKDVSLDDLKWDEQNDSQSKYFERKGSVIPALVYQKERIQLQKIADTDDNMNKKPV